jgi:hypothetical protein
MIFDRDVLLGERLDFGGSGDRRMVIAKSLVFFLAAGLCEIGGGYATASVSSINRPKTGLFFFGPISLVTFGTCEIKSSIGKFENRPRKLTEGYE